MTRLIASMFALAVIVAACSGTPSPASSAALGGASTVASDASAASTVASPSPTTPVSLPTASPHPLAAVTHAMDDLKATRLKAEIQVGSYPDWQVTLDGALWVSTGDGVVARIDQAADKVVERIAVNGPCLGMASGFGSVWAPACEENKLDRIDPKTNTVIARIALPGIPGDGEGQLVAAYGSVWLFTDDNGTLARIDPKTNTIARTFRTGADGVAIVAAEGSLWASVPDHDAVARIGTDGKVLEMIPVGRRPRFIAAGEGAVWSLGQGDGDVTRIDPKTGKVLATIPLYVPGEGGCIAAGGGAIWVTMPGTPVSRIDPATNEVTERFTGAGGDCISFSAGSIWLSNLQIGTVWRISP